MVYKSLQELDNSVYKMALSHILKYKAHISQEALVLENEGNFYHNDKMNPSRKREVTFHAIRKSCVRLQKAGLFYDPENLPRNWDKIKIKYPLTIPVCVKVLKDE